MTKKENKEIAETLLPVFEQALDVVEGKGVNIDLYISEEDEHYCMRVDDYVLVYSEGKITLEYEPLKKGRGHWKREKVIKKRPSEREL